MFMGPRNWFQGMNSASLCSLACRYENPIPPQCLAPIEFLKIPALGLKRNLLVVDCFDQKVRIYKEYHSACPLVGIGTLPTPISPASVPLSQKPRGGRGGARHTRLRARSVSPNSDDWRKSLALCLLCGFDTEGGGESWTREKVRGATIHKAGWEIPIWQTVYKKFVKSLSDKHLPQCSFTWQFFRWHFALRSCAQQLVSLYFSLSLAFPLLWNTLPFLRLYVLIAATCLLNLNSWSPPVSAAHCTASYPICHCPAQLLITQPTSSLYYSLSCPTAHHTTDI